MNSNKFEKISRPKNKQILELAEGELDYFEDQPKKIEQALNHLLSGLQEETIQNRLKRREELIEKNNEDGLDSLEGDGLRNLSARNKIIESELAKVVEVFVENPQLKKSLTPEMKELLRDRVSIYVRNGSYDLVYRGDFRLLKIRKMSTAFGFTRDELMEDEQFIREDGLVDYIFANPEQRWLELNKVLGQRYLDNVFAFLKASDDLKTRFVKENKNKLIALVIKSMRESQYSAGQAIPEAISLFGITAAELEGSETAIKLFLGKFCNNFGGSRDIKSRENAQKNNEEVEAQLRSYGLSEDFINKIKQKAAMDCLTMWSYDRSYNLRNCLAVDLPQEFLQKPEIQKNVKGFYAKAIGDWISDCENLYDSVELEFFGADPESDFKLVGLGSNEIRELGDSGLSKIGFGLSASNLLKAIAPLPYVNELILEPKHKERIFNIVCHSLEENKLKVFVINYFKQEVSAVLKIMELLNILEQKKVSNLAAPPEVLEFHFVEDLDSEKKKEIINSFGQFVNSCFDLAEDPIFHIFKGELCDNLVELKKQLIFYNESLVDEDILILVGKKIEQALAVINEKEIAFNNHYIDDLEKEIPPQEFMFRMDMLITLGEYFPEKAFKKGQIKKEQVQDYCVVKGIKALEQIAQFGYDPEEILNKETKLRMIDEHNNYIFVFEQGWENPEMVKWNIDPSVDFAQKLGVALPEYFNQKLDKYLRNGYSSCQSYPKDWDFNNVEKVCAELGLSLDWHQKFAKMVNGNNYAVVVKMGKNLPECKADYEQVVAQKKAIFARGKQDEKWPEAVDFLVGLCENGVPEIADEYLEQIKNFNKASEKKRAQNDFPESAFHFLLGLNFEEANLGLLSILKNEAVSTEDKLLVVQSITSEKRKIFNPEIKKAVQKWVARDGVNSDFRELNYLLAIENIPSTETKKLAYKKIVECLTVFWGNSKKPVSIEKWQAEHKEVLPEQVLLLAGFLGGLDDQDNLNQNFFNLCKKLKKKESLQDKLTYFLVQANNFHPEIKKVLQQKLRELVFGEDLGDVESLEKICSSITFLFG
ncbi:MAG: hypothetical protein WCT18_01685, partial [Patescibacteria group bacterium]